jgi:outer membrane biosynthesis protein TonB
VLGKRKKHYSIMEPEEETPETEEAQPTEEEESQPERKMNHLRRKPKRKKAEEESEEESEEPEGEEEEELYAVTVNGEEVAVSLDELLSGYSRQSDYTRKTQEVANDRKEMETLQQQYNSECPADSARASAVHGSSNQHDCQFRQ